MSADEISHCLDLIQFPFTTTIHWYMGVDVYVVVVVVDVIAMLVVLRLLILSVG